MPRILVWFSCGAASAVAAKVTLSLYPQEDVRVIYCDTLATEHPDNRRFFNDVQTWIGRDIEVIRSDKYADIDAVFMETRYMSGIAGARCTTELKKKPRETYQRDSDLHVFGYTLDERKRAEGFEERNPALHVEWTLIEQGIDKDDCKRMLAEAGIALPVMYELGFAHNNCLGCVKSTSPGYWNRTRRHFPDVFARRCEQSRALGVRLVRIKGKRVFLDELPPEEDAPDDDIDCGPVCHAPRQLREP